MLSVCLYQTDKYEHLSQCGTIWGTATCPHWHAPVIYCLVFKPDRLLSIKKSQMSTLRDSQSSISDNIYWIPSKRPAISWNFSRSPWLLRICVTNMQSYWNNQWELYPRDNYLWLKHLNISDNHKWGSVAINHNVW